MSKYCTHCKINILDETEYCPLCHSVLRKDDKATSSTGHDKNEICNRYPNISEELRRVSIVRRILLFIALVIGVISVVTNFQTFHGVSWSVIIIYGLLYAIIVVSLFSSERLGSYGKVGWTLFFAFIYTVVIDIVFGFSRWSITYVLPSWLISMNALLVIFMIIDHTKFQSYVMQDFYLVIMSIVLFIFTHAGILQNVILAEVALIMSILTFLGVLILGGRAAHTEIVRRFHI